MGLGRSVNLYCKFESLQYEKSKHMKRKASKDMDFIYQGTWILISVSAVVFNRIIWLNPTGKVTLQSDQDLYKLWIGKTCM
jgi:hypothetical protein